MENSNFINEVKHIRDRALIHENRRYQMLVLSVGGISTVLGFSDKISHLFIPFILIALLTLTSSVVLSQIRHSYFCNAYLLELFDKYQYRPTSTEAYFKHYHTNTCGENNSINPKYQDVYGLSNPFFILFIVSIATSFYFAYDYISKSHATYYIASIVIYLIVFLLGYSYILMNIIKIQKIKIEHFRNICKQYLESIK